MAGMMDTIGWNPTGGYRNPYGGFDLRNQEPEPPEGMMLNPEYKRWKEMYDRYPTNMRGGAGQDMMNDMNRQYRMQMGPAPQQWLYDPNWQRQMKTVNSPQDPSHGMYGRNPGMPATFAPPPGGFAPPPGGAAPMPTPMPVAPPNVGGGAPPPSFLPPPDQRGGLFHQPPGGNAIAQVAQALLAKR